MAKIVCQGTLLQCNFGVAPMPMIVLPEHKTLAGVLPVANINDHLPMANIPSFGLCSCLKNPEVQAATTAALGVLTPMPCMPVTTKAWESGASQLKLAGKPVVTEQSTLKCQWGGEIKVIKPAPVTANTK